MHDGDYDVPERETAFEGDMSTVIGALENICTSVYYIPGNHDPRTTFERNPLPKLTSFSTNIHRRVVRISRDLVFAGYGGSVPSFQNGQVLWSGYPHATDDVVREPLQRLLTLGNDDSGIQHSDSVILMTHFGPDGIDTTLDRSDPLAPVHTGSKSLTAVLRNSPLNIPLHIHGHTHNSPGRVTIGKTIVFNPGSLTESRFALLTLERSLNLHRWVLSSSTFLDLP
ncbi:hypothetical protein, variant [Capsaspora owczarzaki ATCC 30864]|nr:hypothetical protein, variant [Capsaspora owczarzaki ATCC 30864]